MWKSVQICWTEKPEDSRSCPGKKRGEGRDKWVWLVKCLICCVFGVDLEDPWGSCLSPIEWRYLLLRWQTQEMFQIWEGRNEFSSEMSNLRCLWFSQKEASGAGSGARDAVSSSRCTSPTVFSRHLKLTCPKLASRVFSLMCFSTLSLPHPCKRHYPCNCTSWTLDCSRDL